MSKLTIATGIKTFDIEDENGNIRGQIHIDTSDINLRPRAQELVDNIQNYLEEIKDSDDSAELTREVDNKIKAEINTFFNDDNCSDVVFGETNVLSTYNGVTFIERFLSAILPVIEADAKSEKEKSVKRVQNYTSQVK